MAIAPNPPKYCANCGHSLGDCTWQGFRGLVCCSQKCTDELYETQEFARAMLNPSDQPMERNMRVTMTVYANIYESGLGARAICFETEDMAKSIAERGGKGYARQAIAIAVPVNIDFTPNYDPEYLRIRDMIYGKLEAAQADSWNVKTQDPETIILDLLAIDADVRAFLTTDDKAIAAERALILTDHITYWQRRKSN